MRVDRLRRGALVLAVTAGVAACGGGGGDQARDSGSTAPTATPQPTPVIELGDPGATLVLRPPIGQEKGAAGALVPGVASFVPPTEGAEVVVQSREDGGGWKDEAEGKQNAAGQFAFLLEPAPSNAKVEYRATSTIDGKTETTGPVDKSPWKLVWSDEFEGSTLDADWQPIPAGRPCVTISRDLVTLSDGIASIAADFDPSKPKDKDCPRGYFFNGAVGTDASKTFTYGIFAARVKYHKPEGAHGSFWLYPSTSGGPADPAPDDPAQTGVEVDISEYFGDDFGKGEGGGEHHAYVYWPKRNDDGTITNTKTGGKQDLSKLLGNSLPSDGFHVYSVEWTPTEYIFRTDGVEVSRVTVGISKRPQYLLLSLLTSPWETGHLTPTSLPTSMKVDWVRAYQRPTESDPKDD